MKTIVKLSTVLSEAIGPIALLADGLPVTTPQFAPSGLADRHPGDSLGTRPTPRGRFLQHA